ncbi:DUF3013 family protein [Carnobacterium sp.]|uniref:DUF3013 family protein n=1 Tax=Carnobacterium sp. TaxID=48221 RepID=UPI00388E1DBD
MAQETLLDYLGEALEESDFEFDWKLEWNKRQHAIELYFSIFAENKENHVVIEDVEGTANEGEIIQFEDAICFFDPKKSKIQMDNYLKAIPFDFKMSIEKGYVDAVLKTLRIVVTEGQSDLLDFATDPSIDTFELNWNDTNFDGTIKTLKDINRYSEEKLIYPKY